MKLINQLSKETGVPIATIRFYEKSGLFKGKRHPDKKTTYKYYDDEILEKLELIRDAKLIGFTLAEIRLVIDAWYSKRISKQKKLDILDSKLGQIDDRIAELKAMKKQLAAFRAQVEEFDC